MTEATNALHRIFSIASQDNPIGPHQKREITALAVRGMASLDAVETALTAIAKAVKA